MKKVLFVDDESHVLEELRRILAPQQEHWEMAFAPSGAEALRLMEIGPFDVVVTDLRMPVIDGATLLKLVCERYPGMVRIVFATQQEMDVALRTIPIAHQFLLKPCDAVMLRVAIERATSLSDVLNNKLLARTIGSVKDLPVLPRTFMALREKLMSPDASIRDVVKLVEQDVAISAKILQLVNSALFGLPREISTVGTAVSFLGMDMLQNLVLSAEVFRIFEQKGQLQNFSFEELYLHSQLVARIAGQIPASTHIHNAAIVAGMLHDVGKLVLATRSPEHFSRAVLGIEEEGKPLFAVEEKLMGVSHAEVGAYLVGIWGLPCPVVEAIAHHHHPERVPHSILDAVAIVHISNYLAHKYPVKIPSAQTDIYQPLAAEYLESIGVKSSLEEWEVMAEASAKALRETSVALTSK
jgi:putative nucleotidyltransferase with HDIG domain